MPSQPVADQETNDVAAPSAPVVSRVLRTGQAVAVEHGTFFMVALFTLSLIVPMRFSVGSIVLAPYRLILLLFFPILLFRFVSGRAGPIVAADVLFVGSTCWAALALIYNHGIAQVIEPAGLHFVEFLGAYLLGRTAIRSSADFRKMVRYFLMIMFVLAPLAVLESVTNTPILLNLIPNSIEPVNAGMRWGLRRAQTAFAHPIHYGAFASAMLGLFWYAINPTASIGRRLLMYVLTVGATVFSLSTGAMIALVFQTIFIGWELVTKRYERRWTVFFWLCVAAYIVIDIVSVRSPFHVVVNYASFSSNSAYNRILIFNHGFPNVLDNPIFGLGFRDWVRPRFMSPSIDNFWLLMAMRYGAPTFLMLAGGLLWIIRRVSKTPLSDPWDRACRAAYLTSIGGIVIAGSTVHYWHGMMAFVLFMMGTGVWVFTGGARTETEAETAGEEHRAPVARGVSYSR